METLHADRWQVVGPVTGFDSNDLQKMGWLFKTKKHVDGSASYTVSYHITESARLVDQNNRLIRYYEKIQSIPNDSSVTCLSVKNVI